MFQIVLVEYHLSHLWNPQSDQIRWFMERQGYLAGRLMHDWLFVKRDSEFAEGALEIIRSMRQQLANDKTLTRHSEHQMVNPFND